MIEKLKSDKHILGDSDLFDITAKLNELIDSHNTLAKDCLHTYLENKEKIDFIMEKDKPKYDGSEHIKHHTEDRCVDWCPKCKKQ